MVDWQSYIAGAVLGFGTGGLAACIAWKHIYKSACWRADYWERRYREKRDG